MDVRRAGFCYIPVAESLISDYVRCSGCRVSDLVDVCFIGYQLAHASGSSNFASSAAVSCLAAQACCGIGKATCLQK